LFMRTKLLGRYSLSAGDMAKYIRWICILFSLAWSAGEVSDQPILFSRYRTPTTPYVFRMHRYYPHHIPMNQLFIVIVPIQIKSCFWCEIFRFSDPES
jgi:hypothetical protein